MQRGAKPNLHPNPNLNNPDPNLCRHAAQCNEAELRGYVGREKKCPVAFLNYLLITNPDPSPSPNSSPGPNPNEVPRRLLYRRAQAPIGRGARRRVEIEASTTASGRGALLVRPQRRGAECGCAAEL